jgi:signal transduction histidine kinase
MVALPRLNRLRHTRRTIRLRLTLTYGVVFLLTGVILLTIGYLLVRHDLNQRHDLYDESQRLSQPLRDQLFGIANNHILGGASAVGSGTLNRGGVASPGFGGPPLNPGGFAVGRAPGELSRTGRDIRAAIQAGYAQATSEALHRLLIEYIGALVIMTVVSVVAGWLLAGRALAPLRAITATARRVSGQNLGERIALVGPADELKELADTFDGMLERLDRAFGSQRHFVANSSHELRTPLAIMRTEVDVALADPDASVAELRAMGEAIRDTIDRSEALIAALLMLARSEAIAGRGERIDLVELAADCVTDLHLRAESSGIVVTTDLQPAVTRAEPALLERVTANLIDNAIRHNTPGGHLHVRTRTVGDEVELVVENGGQVIDPVTAQGLIEPFRRLNRAVGGFGLGLSIVRSVAEAHGGSVTLAAPAAGGLTVTVRLPRLGTEAAPARARRVLTRS